MNNTFVDIVSSDNYCVRLYYETGCISFFNLPLDKVKDFNYDESVNFMNALMLILPVGYHMSKILGNMDGFLDAGWKEYSK